jgi:hypothetical protein
MAQTSAARGRMQGPMDEDGRENAAVATAPTVNVACWVNGDDDRIDDVRDGTLLLSRLWFERVLPELARRGIKAPPEECVERVQVVHGIDGTVTVRLNEETKIAMLFRYEGPPIDRADFVYAPERVGSVQAVELTDDDPVAAHEVAIRGATGWWVSFDFRYYRKKIAECVRTAIEFAYAARASLEANCLHAFAENLFVAAEHSRGGICSSSPGRRFSIRVRTDTLSRGSRSGRTWATRIPRSRNCWTGSRSCGTPRVTGPNDSLLRNPKRERRWSTSTPSSA